MEAAPWWWKERPELVAKTPESHTGRFLAPLLDAG